MEKQEQIKTLLNMNWSYRAIEKATGIRRETISKYDHRKTAKVPPMKIQHRPTAHQDQKAQLPDTTLK